MTTELMIACRLVGQLVLVLSVQLLVVLALRKPVRAWLGAIASYRLWLLVPLWLPLFAVAGRLLQWAGVITITSHPVAGGAVATRMELPIDGWQLSVDVGARNTTAAAETTWLWLLALAWLAGFLAIVGWYVWRAWQFNRYVMLNAQSLTAAAQQQLQAQAVVGSEAQVFGLPGLGCAALFGVWHPVLLLPEDFAERHDADQRHIILAHEAVHLRRCDNAWNLIVMLAVAVFWWSPLSWLALRCFRFDQELSCDAQALAACSRTQQQRYARTLLDTIRVESAIGPQPALSAWGNLGEMRQRMLMIASHLTIAVSPATMRAALAAVAFAGAAVTVTVSATLAPIMATAETMSKNSKDSDAGWFSPAVVKMAVPIRLSSPIAESDSQPLLFSEKTLGSDAGYQLQQIANLIDQGKMDEAMNHLDALLQKGASDHDIYAAAQLKVRIYWGNRMYAEARAAAVQASMAKNLSSSERASLQLVIAFSWLSQQEWKQGAEAMEVVMQQYPASIDAHVLYQTSVCYYNLGQYDKALAYAEKSIRLDARHATSLYYRGLGNLYRQQQRYAEARDILQQSVERFHDSESEQALREVESRLQ